MYKIISNQQIGNDFYIMTIEGSFEAKPGQFYMLRGIGSFMTLSRPISVFDVEADKIAFMYRVVGEGTKYFSKLKEGDEITLYGPYGNGYPVSEYKDKKVALIGGGMGIAPLFYLAKKLDNAEIHLGLNSRDLTAEQKQYLGQLYATHAPTTIHIDTDMSEKLDFSKYDAVMTCGPEIMMYKLTKKHEDVYVSLEKHMGCAVGACLSCTCDVGGKRVKVCKDGPVFKGSEVSYDDAIKLL